MTRKIVEALQLLVALLLVGYVMYYAAFLPFERSRGAIIYLSLAAAYLLLRSLSNEVGIFGIRNRWLTPIISAILLILAVAAGAYFFQDYYEILYYRVGVSGTTLDYVLGAAMLIIVLELVRRDVERVIALLAIAFILYALLGPYIPEQLPLSSVLRHKGMALDYLLLYLTSYISTGIYGMLTEIAFTWISAFVIFASVLRALGGYDALFSLMRYIATRSPYLVPQTGVIGSALFGMYSGSAPANVAGTGIFTIPMNVRVGVPARFAAAIEAVASSGGLIVPPVMGAAAFIMASVLGTSYISVVKAAIIPALLYYLVTSAAVLFISSRYLDVGKAAQFVRESRDVGLSDVIKRVVPFLLAVAFLVWLLAYQKLDPLIAAVYSTVAYAAFAFAYNYAVIRRDMGLQRYVRHYLGELKNGILEAAMLSATLGVMLASINIITSVLNITGQDYKLSLFLSFSAGESLIRLVFFVWLIVVILGFGVSTTGVYVIAISLTALAFAKAGLSGESAIIYHFFIFWVATLSAITPPVAIAAITAAKIANERFVPVAVESIKIGLPLFVLPFSFFVWPEVLLVGSNVALAALALAVSSLAVTASMYHSFSYLGPMALPARVLALLLGLAGMMGRGALGSTELTIVLALNAIISISSLYFAVKELRRNSAGELA